MPHSPHNPPKALEEKYAKLTDSPHIARYWAMVEWFDQTTGDLLHFLKEKGLEENTIIVYTCDNGWIQSEGSTKYASRSKRAPHEGGIRTPIMFKYPKKIQPHIDTQNLVNNVDIVPTVLSLLGLEKGNLPGIDVLNESALNQQKITFAESYNHDITNIEEQAISVSNKNGFKNIATLPQGQTWPDGLYIGNDGHIYSTVDQLNRIPALNNGKDDSKPPYLIIKTPLVK